MLAEERKEKIMDIIEKTRIVKVAELSSRFDATEATIRRDLEELQGQGKLRRIHGGAIFTNPVHQDFKYSDLSVLHIEEKNASLFVPLNSSTITIRFYLTALQPPASWQSFLSKVPFPDFRLSPTRSI